MQLRGSDSHRWRRDGKGREPSINASLCSGILANSRITLQNNADNNAGVGIFNGDDSACDVVAKNKHVSKGKSMGMGCKGGGNNQCKVIVSAPTSDDRPCKDNYNTCSSKAMKVPNGATVVISSSYNCSINTN